ncbi:MAG: hypothetical protein EA383_15710 [Spirochaetaceae bacterium]|nr:MAG: hypothetical protein EA383_15710 [Spirochaetaceae bacterium]
METKKTIVKSGAIATMAIGMLVLLGSCQLLLGFGNVQFANETGEDLPLTAIRFGDAEHEFDDNTFANGSVIPSGNTFLRTTAVVTSTLERKLTPDGDWAEFPGAESWSVESDEFYTIRIGKEGDDFTVDLIEEN